MLEVEVRLASRVNPASVSRTVERLCRREGLTLTAKTTLAKYPGSVHWHFKMGKKPGTLEVTWWRPEGRLWFKVAGNRTGAWIEDTVAQLKSQLQRSR